MRTGVPCGSGRCKFESRTESRRGACESRDVTRLRRHSFPFAPFCDGLRLLSMSASLPRAPAHREASCLHAGLAADRARLGEAQHERVPVSAEPARRRGDAQRNRRGWRFAAALSESEEFAAARGGRAIACARMRGCARTTSSSAMARTISSICSIRLSVTHEAAAGFTLPSYSLYPVLVGIQNGRANVIEFDRSMRLPVDRIVASTRARVFPHFAERADRRGVFEC